MAIPIRLIHPIYLDVPMLVSFAAAIEGGLSFGSEVTAESTTTKSAEVSIAGKFGLGALFSMFLEPSVELNAGVDVENSAKEIRREARAHTEASVAILLYDRLRRAGGYIVDPQNLADLENVEPGALVEIAGTIEKNAIDAMIDCIDAASILGELGGASPAGNSTGIDQKNSNKSKTGTKPQNVLSYIRETLDRDRKRTPISNVLLRCSIPKDAKAIVTLRTENLRDLTLSELHKNSVRILGKITRVVHAGASVSPFENYGMALLKPEILAAILAPLVATEGMNVQFSEVQLDGPAVQILPLMVFV